jgi:transaldolase
MATPSLLEQLTQLTTVVPETADIEVLQQLGSQDANLSASLITAAAQQPQHAAIVDAAMDWAQMTIGKGGNRKLAAIRAVERLAMEFAKHILELIPGSVSIAIDGRLAYKRRQTIERARAMLKQLDDAGVDRERVLLKIPATWEGIEAARKLRDKDGLRAHMILVFGMHQLAACADAGAAVVAPAVGRITDFHKKQQGVAEFAPADDPGVQTALRMGRYLEEHGYATRLMPGMFRGHQQALALAGCPSLSLPCKLIEVLKEERGSVEALPPPDEVAAKLAVDQGNFEALHGADPVSSKKLQSGVKNLSWAVVAQETQLVEWIARRQDEQAESSTLQLFRIWDYDGDGFIDREEWGGTDAVFNALDRDNNGRISLEEMAVGLGAPYNADD